MQNKLKDTSKVMQIGAKWFAHHDVLNIAVELESTTLETATMEFRTLRKDAINRVRL
jgi:hypothetical protein